MACLSKLICVFILHTSYTCICLMLDVSDASDYEACSSLLCQCIKYTIETVSLLWQMGGVIFFSFFIPLSSIVLTLLNTLGLLLFKKGGALFKA